MAENAPTIQKLRASEARQQFSQILNRVFRREARVIVEKSGIPVAAIISADDLARFRQLEEAAREADFQAVDSIRQAFQDVPDQELAREVARAIRKVRADRQRQSRTDSPAA